MADQPTTANEDVLTIREAAGLARIAVVTAYNLADRGQLPGAVKIGGSWRVSRRTLEAHLHGAEATA